jgi:hypothetical protein
VLSSSFKERLLFVLLLLLGLWWMFSIHTVQRIERDEAPQPATICPTDAPLLYERDRHAPSPIKLPEEPIADIKQAPPEPERVAPKKRSAPILAQQIEKLPGWIDVDALYRATHGAFDQPPEAFGEIARDGRTHRFKLFGGTVEIQEDEPAQKGQWVAKNLQGGDLFQALGNRWITGTLSGEGEIIQRAENTTLKGVVNMESGILPRLDFALLYCRAAAFAAGEPMPPEPYQAQQPFSQMRGQWVMQKAGWQLGDMELMSDRFKLTGAISGRGDRLRGHFELSLRKPLIHPCGVDERWQAVVLPMTCSSRGSEGLHCSLNLRQLGENIETIATGTRSPTEKRSLERLQGDLMEQRQRLYPSGQPSSPFANPKQFKDRTIEGSTIEEHDLRPLFSP